MIFGAAIALYFFRKSPTPTFPTEVQVFGIDLKSGKELSVTAGVGDRAPYVNPDTGERTVYPWYYCWECEHRFVPQPNPAGPGEPPTIPNMPRCPLCGGANTGSWGGPEDPLAYQPKGDAPLPELP